MFDIGLVLAASLALQPQAATLEGCEFVEERWVCRYRLPDIQLLDDGARPTVAVPALTAAPPVGSVDPGVLTEDQVALVARCADAGWMSLCLPSQRTEARRLRDLSLAYETARREVGTLIGEGRCEDARSRALGGGYLGLAREAQGLCAGRADGAQ